jgi:hypothetical protein
MKPLEFTLEEMRDVLGVLDALEATDPAGSDHEALVDRLLGYRQAADARVAALREQLEVAEGFAADLRREIGRQKRLTRQGS